MTVCLRYMPKRRGMGTSKLYNGAVNIMHSMTVGDGTFWHMANENPYPRTFFEKNKSSGQERNVLAFYYTEGKGEVTNGYVQFLSLIHI